MFMTYNGVRLEYEKTTEFVANPVYSDDGVDLLYVEFTIGVDALWGSAAAPSHLNGSGQIVNDGNRAAVSLGNLRATLTEPRRPLQFTVPLGAPGGPGQVPGGTDVVDSPQFDLVADPSGATRYTMDANNGPKPLGFQILEIRGQNYAKVRFRIKTCVVSCTTAQSCISNRWSMSTDLDQEHFLTRRRVQGVAVFRTDEMTKRGFKPDDFRGSVIPVPPYGFQRSGEVVTASSDNTRLEYNVVDEEQTLLMSDQYRRYNIIRVGGTFTDGYGVGVIGVGSARMGGSIGSGIGKFIGGEFGGAAGGILGGVVGGIAGLFPPRVATLNIRIWGNRDATRENLIKGIAAAATSFNIGGITNQAGDQTTTLQAFVKNFLITGSTTLAIERKYVEMTLVFKACGALSRVMTNLGGPGGFALFTPPIFDQWDGNLGAVAVDAATNQGLATANPRNSFNTRATFATSLATAPVKSTCDPAIGRRQVSQGNVGNPIQDGLAPPTQIN